LRSNGCGIIFRRIEEVTTETQDARQRIDPKEDLGPAHVVETLPSVLDVAGRLPYYLGPARPQQEQEEDALTNLRKLRRIQLINRSLEGPDDGEKEDEVNDFNAQFLAIEVHIAQLNESARALLDQRKVGKRVSINPIFTKDKKKAKLSSSSSLQRTLSLLLDNVDPDPKQTRFLAIQWQIAQLNQAAQALLNQRA
jgi:hypothetical protein